MVGEAKVLRVCLLVPGRPATSLVIIISVLGAASVLTHLQARVLHVDVCAGDGAYHGLSLC